jgi:hypothetical protein
LVTFAWGFPLTRLQAFANRSVAAAERDCDLSQAHSGRLHFRNPLNINLAAAATEFLAMRPRIAVSGLHPFDNQVLF